MKIHYLLFLIFTCIAHSAETIKVAFLAQDATNAYNYAIFNGAKDAFLQMQSRYSTKFELTYFSANESYKKQLEDLDKAFVDGCCAAIIAPVNSEKLLPKLKELSDKNFQFASVLEPIDSEYLLFNISADYPQIQKLLQENLKKYSDALNLHYLCVFHDVQKLENLSYSDEKLAKYLKDKMPVDTFKEIFPEKFTTIGVCNLYSVYDNIYKNMIRSWDNYIVVAFDAEIFADLTPIYNDIDRCAIITLDSIAQMSYYLANEQINVCIMQDYYSYGYYSGRVLAEKIMDNVNPEQKDRKVAPILIKPDDLKSFEADWHKWLK